MQILATDFDGTLYRNGTVSAEDKAAIARFRAAGNKFGIVTGRHLATALYETERQNVTYDFLICCTGGMILDAENNILFERRIPREGVLPLYRKTVECGGAFFSASRFQELLWYDMGVPSIYASATVLPVEKLSEADGFHEMTTCFADEGTAQHYVDLLNASAPEWFTAHQNGVYADVCAPHTDKVSGLRAVLQYFDASANDLSVAGDNLNDLSMIRTFHSFAISSGRAELKQAAAHTVSKFREITEMLL